MPKPAAQPEEIRSCVMGWPVNHSLSPKMHGWWLELYHICGSYGMQAVEPKNLKDALQQLLDQGYAGCNLTLPLKEEALGLMDIHDESALTAGAVNTVVVKNGKLHGYDSDGYGFIENLKAQHADWSGERVAIVGTGGASRSIISSLKKAGAQRFVLVNRTRERAQKIIENFELDADICDWENRSKLLKDATMLVNCTSLGMKGQPPLEIDLAALPTTAVVCDLVYRPIMTPLLRQAAERGNPVVDGMGMLIHQGRLGFKLWYGRDPEVTPEIYAFMKGCAA